MAESRVEDLLETGVEQPVLPMSEIEAILRGEPVTPHSRIAELLLKYNPSDILIEKRITENGTYFATNDNADGYYKVVVDEYVPKLIFKEVTANGTYDPAVDGADGYSSIRVNLPLEHQIGEVFNQNGLYHVTPSQGYEGISRADIMVQVNPVLETKTIDANGTYTPSQGYDGFSEVTVNVPGQNADIHIHCLGVDGGTVTITATDGSTTYTHTASVTLTDETVIFDELEYAGIWTVSNSKDATTATVDNTFIEGNVTLMVTKIPLMTSVTTPYGECISSSNNWGEGYWRYLPFDGQNGSVSNDGADAWTNQRGDNSPWIGYHFMDSNNDPIKVKMDKVWVQGFCVLWSSSTTRTLYFEGSNDGTNWEKIGLDKTFDFGINTRQSFEHELNGGKYEYFRIRFDASLNAVDSRWIFIERIQVYANDFAPLPTGALTATENGTYDPEDYDLSAFSEVTVNVPLPQNALLLKDIPSTPTAIATFADGAEMVMPSLKVAIEPQQDLHGYDSPWVGGAGKNKLQVTATSQTINGVTFTVNDDGTIKVNGTATADARFVIGEYILKAGSSVRLNGSPVDGSNSTIALGYQGYGIVSTANSDRVCDRTSASTDWDNDVYINVTSGYTANNLTFKPMIRLASVADATFAPYSNECPILGWDECKVTVADDLENPTVSNVYTIDLDGTRYGGKLDVVNGVLTADRAYVDLGSLDWTYYSVAQGSLFRSDITNMKPTSNTLLANCICSQYSVVTQDNRTNGTISSAYNTTLIDVIDNRYSDATAFKTAMSGVQLVYELATPQTIQLTPTAVKSLEGVNNVVADSGEILEGEYLANPN